MEVVFTHDVLNAACETNSHGAPITLIYNSLLAI